jgi:hypothetical protein
MRRLVVMTLIASAAAAATLVLGAALVAGSPTAPAAPVHGAHAVAHAAKPPPLAGLDRTFRALIPSTRCDEGAAKAVAGKRIRAAALKGAAKATPKVLKRKKAAMRSAIAAMRRAKALCAAAAAAGPGGTPAPGAPAPGPGTTPGAPAPTQTIVLHVAAGNTFTYTETSATATAGAMRLELQNASNIRHFVAVRTASGQPTIASSPLSLAGGTVFVDVTLAPGTYEIFCNNNNHDVMFGMKIPLTVSY